MSFAGWTQNLAAMADRIGAMKRKVCAVADRQKRWKVVEYERTVPFPLGVDISTRSQPRFERWTENTYWYVQGNRFVSREEMLRILRAYFARQAAVRLFEERRAQGGE